MLDAGLRGGLSLSFSCRGGTCQTCLMRCVGGRVPERAQRGLDADLKALGYFLPCVCVPEASMEVAARRPEDFVIEGLVESSALEQGCLTLVLEPMKAITAAVGDRFEVAIGAAPWVPAIATGVPSEAFYLSLRLDPLDSRLDRGSLRAGDTVRVRPAPPPSDVPDADQGPGTLPTGSTTDAGSETGVALPPINPALWASLDDGRLVRAVLDDFYRTVYDDPDLSPYFRGVTREHVAGKQYSFLKRCMTGEKVYFGETPRNAHHWMVISDTLFDHRQALMRAAQRRQGLTDDQMRGWDAYELPFRPDLVKNEAFPRVQFGHVLPLDGFEELALDIGTICDSCGTVLEPGTVVRVHKRLGTINCPACTATPA